MNLLLTGGLGYIGSHAAAEFFESGHNVVLVDNLSNSSLHVLESLKRIVDRSLPFYELDVNDSNGLASVIRAHDINCVIHFAGLKSVADSIKSPTDYYRNNVGGTITLLEAMSATGVRKLVFSSSATVYGIPQYLPLDEDHPTIPVNPYGRSKLMVESILRDQCDADPSWGIVSLRYFNPVGAHVSGHIGDRPIGEPNNLMPYVNSVAERERPFLNIFGNDYDTPDGTGVRDYIHIADLVLGHACAVRSLKSDALGFKVFNLGTGLGHSVLDLVKHFEFVSNVEIPFRIMGRRSGDVAVSYASARRAESELNWTATRDIRDICKSVWNFSQRRRSGAGGCN